jgi:ABC-type uncharacterized transport system YnjBCD ATPase subunit
MNDVIIELQDVKKIYEMDGVETPALRGINLKINKGEFVAIMGPSGSGKSTLLHMVGALDTPTSGKVFLDGVDISTLKESDLARLRGKKIGIVFQFFNLHLTLTALENIELPMIIVERDKKEQQRARELQKAVGLEHRAHHLPSQISGGIMNTSVSQITFSSNTTKLTLKRTQGSSTMNCTFTLNGNTLVLQLTFSNMGGFPGQPLQNGTRPWNDTVRPPMNETCPINHTRPGNWTRPDNGTWNPGGRQRPMSISFTYSLNEEHTVLYLNGVEFRKVQ